MNDEISFLHVPTESEVTPEVRALWAKSQERLGFVPNVFRAQALNPAQFSAWWAYFNALVNRGEFLTPLERELVAVVVSAQNRCVYCLVSHGAAVRELSGDAVLADTVAIDHRAADLPLRARAMLDYAVQLTRRPQACGQEDLRPLREAGLTDHEILELVQVIGMFNLTNRVSSALGFVPNREYYGHAREQR